MRKNCQEYASSNYYFKLKCIETMVDMVNTYRIRINIDNLMMDFVGYGNATNVVMETCLFEHDI